MGTGVESGIGQLRKGGKGIGRFAVALIVAYVITVLALFGIAFVMLKLQPDAGTTELLTLRSMFFHVLQAAGTQDGGQDSGSSCRDCWWEFCILPFCF